MEKLKREYRAELTYRIIQIGANEVQAAYFGEGYLPVIVDRGASASLEEVVAGAINRGLIVGVKPSAAGEIARGVMEQMYEEFGNGEAVKFDDFFTARLYLRGTTDAAGTLTADNQIGVALTPGPEWDIDIGDFKMKFAGAGTLPKIDSVNSIVDGSVEGELQVGQPIAIVGKNLTDSSGATVIKLDVDGSVLELETTEVAGSVLIKCAWPSGVSYTGIGHIFLQRADGTFTRHNVTVWDPEA